MREFNIIDEIYHLNHLQILAKEYLKILEPNVEYKCYYINDNLEIIQGKGIIKNDGLYNYHKNEDISNDTLYVIGYEYKNKPKWWSLSLDKAKQKQSQLIALKLAMLNKQIEKTENVKGKVKFIK